MDKEKPKKKSKSGKKDKKDGKSKQPLLDEENKSKCGRLTQQRAKTRTQTFRTMTINSMTRSPVMIRTFPCAMDLTEFSPSTTTSTMRACSAEIS